MKKRKLKKLMLSRETVLNLDGLRAAAAGDYMTYYPCTTQCPTGYWVTCGPTTLGAACDTTPCENEPL